jgi:hypothetical protein
MMRARRRQLRASWPARGAEIAAFDQRILSLARAHPLARRPISLPRHQRFDRRPAPHPPPPR